MGRSRLSDTLLDMDPALWLLLRLRLLAWFRRFTRNLLTLKGILLIVVVALFFLPCAMGWLLSVLHEQRSGIEPARLEQVQTQAPVALLSLCLLMLLTNTGSTTGVSFSGPEVDFLFAAPLSRRQLLLYKVVVIILGALLSGLFLVFGAGVALSGYCFLPYLYGAAFLYVLFINLFQVVLGLLASTVGAQAYNRGRRIVLGILVLLVAGVILFAGTHLWRTHPQDALARLGQSSLLWPVLAPFHCFVGMGMAQSFMPGFVGWGIVCLALDLALIALVFGLDAHYLEASALASERAHARLQRFRQGGASGIVLGSGQRGRFGLPDLPRWGGVGPVAWRQLQSLPRSRGTLIMVVVFAPLFVLFLVGPVRGASDPSRLPLLLAGQALYATFLFSSIIFFDFRADLDRMDYLKTWPIHPMALTVGQLLGMTLFLTLLELVTMALLVALGPGSTSWLALAACALFAVPLNFFIVGCDNFLFLLFPIRAAAGPHSDVQHIGRQLLLAGVKALAIGISVGIPALAGALVYLLTQKSIVPALATAWLLLTAFALGIVPLVAWAFERFDVSRDVPPP